MYKDVLSSINGVEIYPIFSLLVFFSFFVALSVWFFTVDPKRLRKNAGLPLDEEEKEQSHE